MYVLGHERILCVLEILGQIWWSFFRTSCKEGPRWFGTGEDNLTAALSVRLKNKVLYSPLIQFGKNDSKRRADEQILTSPICHSFVHFTQMNALKSISLMLCILLYVKMHIYVYISAWIELVCFRLVYNFVGSSISSYVINLPYWQLRILVL
jgi:hypothetical protein